jgi:hypothetical protein
VQAPVQQVCEKCGQPIRKLGRYSKRDIAAWTHIGMMQDHVARPRMGFF